jgi:hypothetical protein
LVLRLLFRKNLLRVGKRTLGLLGLLVLRRLGFLGFRLPRCQSRPTRRMRLHYGRDAIRPELSQHLRRREALKDGDESAGEVLLRYHQLRYAPHHLRVHGQQDKRAFLESLRSLG